MSVEFAPQRPVRKLADRTFDPTKLPSHRKTVPRVPTSSLLSDKPQILAAPENVPRVTLSILVQPEPEYRESHVTLALWASLKSVFTANGKGSGPQIPFPGATPLVSVQELPLNLRPTCCPPANTLEPPDPAIAAKGDKAVGASTIDHDVPV